MNIKKLTMCVLAGILLLMPYVSCTETPAENPESVQQTETESETEKVYPEYSLTFNGADFNMLYYDAVEGNGWGNSIPCDIAVEELTGDVLSDAVFNRNVVIEELYDIKFHTDSILTPIQCLPIEQQVISGSTDFDACFPGWNSLYSMVVNGHLTDLEPLFDFSMPWYDEKSRDAFSVLGKSYAAISDLTYMDKMLSVVVIFNKQMAKDYNLGDLYQIVEDGDWTLDLMEEMCELVSADANGDGQLTLDDRYGVYNRNDGVYQFYHSAGQQFCTLDQDGIFRLTLGTEQSVSVLQRVYDLLCKTDIYFHRQLHPEVTSPDIWNMFANDQFLFIMRQIQTVFELRPYETEFGIIPTPKVLENQQDYCTSIAYTVAITEAIPLTVKDLEMSVAVLDTMAAESYYTVNPALYEKILGSKLVQDETSRKNLDIILENRIYDPGCVYNFADISYTIMNGFGEGSGQVASIIAANENKVNTAIDEFIAALQGK